MPSSEKIGKCKHLMRTLIFKVSEMIEKLHHIPITYVIFSIEFINFSWKHFYVYFFRADNITLFNGRLVWHRPQMDSMCAGSYSPSWKCRKISHAHTCMQELFLIKFRKFRDQSWKNVESSHCNLWSFESLLCILYDWDENENKFCVIS